jgi:hypothetical protein
MVAEAVNFAKNNQRWLKVILVVAILFFGFRYWANRDVAAYVNGRPLKIRHQIEKMTERYKKKDPGRFAGLDAAKRELDFKRGLLETKVTLELQAQAAEKVGLTVSPSEINKYIANMKKDLKTKAAWENYLADQGLTEAEFPAEVKRILLAGKWINYVIKTVPKVTDAQARAYYRANKQYQNKPFEQVVNEIKTKLYFEMEKNTMYNTQQALLKQANIYKYY